MNFEYGVTKEHAHAIVKQFIEERLRSLDIIKMPCGKATHGSFTHISFYLNCGLLTPMSIVRQPKRPINGHAP